MNEISDLELHGDRPRNQAYRSPLSRNIICRTGRPLLCHRVTIGHEKVILFRVSHLPKNDCLLLLAARS